MKNPLAFLIFIWLMPDTTKTENIWKDINSSEKVKSAMSRWGIDNLEWKSFALDFAN